MIWAALVLGSVAAGWLLGHGDAAANARMAGASAPADLLAVAFGAGLGFYGRERIRLRRTYASPTLAYLGKALFFTALSAAAAWVLSPLSWSPEWLHGSAAAGSAGLAVWLGNLPSRL